MSTQVFGLPASTVQIIQSILAETPSVNKAVIYGSRAKGNYRLGSDIDLTLFGDSLTLDELGKIATKLHDSRIPYQVDLSIFDLIEHEGLRDHIQRVGRIFYEAKPTIG